MRGSINLLIGGARIGSLCGGCVSADIWFPISREPVKVGGYATEAGKIPPGPEGSNGMP